MKFIVACLFALVIQSASAAVPNQADYYMLTGEVAAAVKNDDTARNEAIKLGTLPVTTKAVSYTNPADYQQLFAVQQPAAPMDCPDGLCPYQQPIGQMIRSAQPQQQIVYYTQAEDPGYLPPGDEVPCGAEAYAYAAADDSPCGSSTYAQANVETACGAAAYSAASDRRQARWERRKARREARAQATARAAFRPLRRLLGRC